MYAPLQISSQPKKKKKTSYLGVTVHWIKTDTLERESAVLACWHFPSPHTYSRTAELLEEIHTEYGLTT